MEVTQRDLALLRAIQSYAILTSEHINELVFSGVKRSTVLRRLRKLEKEGYIQRFSDRTIHVYWLLGKRAIHLVSDRPTKTKFRVDQFNHDTDLVELRIALEGLGIVRSWKPEHELRAELATKYGYREINQRVIPDGIIGIEKDSRQTRVALELELHPKNLRRYQRILEDYAYRVECDAVWYVVKTHVIGRMIEKVRRRMEYCFDDKPLYWSVLRDLLGNPETAPLYGKDVRTTVAELWGATGNELRKHPAHPLAFDVSYSRDESERIKDDLTAEEQTENLVPVM